MSDKRRKSEKPETVEVPSIKSAVSSALKKKNGFNLEEFKKNKNLLNNAKFKPQEWLPLSEAFNKAISLPGLPLGHISVIRGHSDTGKTTAMCEAAMAAQKLGKLPVFVITEMKWSWDHAIKMGFAANMEPDKETGEVMYSGDFIYVDRGSLATIEDVASFIADLFDEQKKGKLPYDLVFLWDSAGSIPSLQSIQSGKSNAMWNAGSMSINFGNFINQMFPLSRKPDSKFTNTFIVVNKVRVDYPIGNPMAKPKLRNKGGDCMYWDATVVVTFGNITNSGTSKITATKDGKKVTFAKRTKISVDKNHITDATSESTILMTTYGFIDDTPKAIDKYKKEHRNEWLNVLGDGEFEIIEEDEATEDIKDVIHNYTEEDVD